MDSGAPTKRSLSRGSRQQQRQHRSVVIQAAMVEENAVIRNCRSVQMESPENRGRDTPTVLHAFHA